MAELITLPMLLQAGATALTAAGTIAGGMHAKAAGDFQAEQMRRQAMEERAATQRDQFEIDKRTEQAQSRLQALSSSSGLGATDPTVLQLAGDIEGEGAYQRGLAGYAGQTRAQSLETGAQAAIMQGRAARNAAFIGAGSTIVGGAANMYDKYAPKKATAGTYRYG